MVRWRWSLLALGWAFGPSEGWWHPAPDEGVHQANETCWSDPLQCLQQRMNTTVSSAQQQFASLTTWDSIVLTILDTLLSGVGWLVFGQNWIQVRTGCSVVLRVATLMAVCLVLHYFLALAWPLCSLIIGGLLTLVWLIRACVKCCGRVAFYTQRLVGGVPEVTGATFFGPDTGEVPETAELRKLKKGANEDRWVLLRRDGHIVIIKVVENAAIKSSGMYLTFDPEATRGDPPLLLALKGYERVHLCRHDSCPEEGQHFKSYALARQLNPEKFHLMSTAAGAQRSGSKVMSWFWSRANQTAKKLKDYASESEHEEVARCCAHQVWWESSTGRESLGDRPCVRPAVTPVELLEEDLNLLPAGHTATMCPHHAVQYLTRRASTKCSVDGCRRVCTSTRQGLRMCATHEELQPLTPTRRSSRSRSRVRELPPAEDEGDDRLEGEGEDRLRRRGRGREVAYNTEEAEAILREVRDDGPDAHAQGVTRRKRVAAPGHTPKSSVQHSLARMGLINSPDRRGELTFLEEFMEQLRTARICSSTRRTSGSRWQPNLGSPSAI